MVSGATPSFSAFFSTRFSGGEGDYSFLLVSREEEEEEKKEEDSKKKKKKR